jgi:hypothetical protein
MLDRRSVSANDVENVYNSLTLPHRARRSKGCDRNGAETLKVARRVPTTRVGERVQDETR